MGSSAAMSKIALVWAMVLMLWPGTIVAEESQNRAAAPRESADLEVLTGSYYCQGTVYTDEQRAEISVGAYMSATSGITEGFSPSYRSTSSVPSDLAAMATICEAHVEQVVSQVSRICTIGPIERNGGTFSNGSNTWSQLYFSCEGRRNQIIRTIGTLSRIPLTAPID